MIYICIMRAYDEYYLLCEQDDDKIDIDAKESLGDWINQYERGYNRAHNFSFSMSMSACINAITMRPSIIGVEGIEDIKERLLDESLKICHGGNVSGSFTGITSGKDMSEEWEKGVKPRMISDI